MCFVEIDDFETAFGEGHRRVRQNVFDGRYHIANRLNLNGFYSQYIVGFVHRQLRLYPNRKIDASIFILYLGLIVFPG